MKVNTIQDIQIHPNGNSCDITWGDGHVSKFHSKWLRFNCPCKVCEDVHTLALKQDVENYPDHIPLKEVKVEGSTIKLKFSGEVFEGHVGQFSCDWLRSFCYCDACLKENIKSRDVIKKHANTERLIRSIDYEEITSDQKRGLFKLMKYVIEDGFCVVKNLPDKLEMAEEMAGLIGVLEATGYGKTFDVTDKTHTKVNTAYTTRALPFHQDMNVNETAPGLVILHAYRFDSCVTGGESMLVDAFNSVEILREEAPDDFQTLVEVPGCWGMCDPDHFKIFQEMQKPHIKLNYFGEVVGVNWGPELSSPVRIKECDVERYYKAWKTFSKILKREENMFRFKMEAGDLLVINNRRMVHSREAYQTNGGDRFMRGAYSNADIMKSKYIALAKELNYDIVPPKIGNNSSL